LNFFQRLQLTNSMNHVPDLTIYCLQFMTNVLAPESFCAESQVFCLFPIIINNNYFKFPVPFKIWICYNQQNFRFLRQHHLDLHLILKLFIWRNEIFSRRRVHWTFDQNQKVFTDTVNCCTQMRILAIDHETAILEDSARTFQLIQNWFLQNQTTIHGLVDRTIVYARDYFVIALFSASLKLLIRVAFHSIDSRFAGKILKFLPSSNLIVILYFSKNDRGLSR
jgi:hypothetical protein